MGFLKNLINKITGGGAKVSIEIDEAVLCEPFVVKVFAEVGDADLKIDKVYLYVKSTERARFDNVEMRDHRGELYTQDMEFGNEAFRQNFVVSGPEVLKANQTYEWEIQIELPEEAAPTFIGRNIQHVWEFYAGLDAAGNDPDSGWVIFDVY